MAGTSANVPAEPVSRVLQYGKQCAILGICLQHIAYLLVIYKLLRISTLLPVDYWAFRDSKKAAQEHLPVNVGICSEWRELPAWWNTVMMSVSKRRTSPS